MRSYVRPICATHPATWPDGFRLKNPKPLNGQRCVPHVRRGLSARGLKLLHDFNGLATLGFVFFGYDIWGLWRSFRFRTVQTIRAVLFAVATVASRGDLRSSRVVEKGSARSGLALICLRRAVMPATARRLMYLSPNFEMRPRLSFPPLDRFNGVSPSHATSSLRFRNWHPLPAVAPMADAVMGLTLGMVLSKMTCGSLRASIRMRFSALIGRDMQKDWQDKSFELP